MKRECKKCNKLKPLDTKHFKREGRPEQKYFRYTCKVCVAKQDRDRRYRYLDIKANIERAVIGHKNEPYYYGEDDRENDLQRILNYKTGDVWTQE